MIEENKEGHYGVNPMEARLVTTTDYFSQMELEPGEVWERYADLLGERCWLLRFDIESEWRLKFGNGSTSGPGRFAVHGSIGRSGLVGLDVGMKPESEFSLWLRDKIKGCSVSPNPWFEHGYWLDDEFSLPALGHNGITLVPEWLVKRWEDPTGWILEDF